jgi:hypothetical protein
MITVTSCSVAQQITIKTLPDKSNIKIIDNNGDVTELGTSPISISAQQIFQGKQFVKLEISKEQFKQENIFLTKPHSSQSIDVSIKLNRTLVNDNSIDKKIDNFAFTIAEIQNKIHQKNLSQAEELLRKLIQKYNHLSVPHDLMGNVHYLNGRKSSALKEYLTANSIDPTNFKRKNIIQRIKRDLGQDN